MKYFRYFLIAGVAFVGLSSNTSRSTQPSEGIYPGDLFSDIKNLENVSGTTVNLSDLKGQKVLVNFWAAYDASSRMDNVLLTNVIEQNDYPVKVVSVSFDKSESVFERTIALDQVDKENQYWIDGKVQSDLFKQYQLEKGFKNYLIDENGMIVAMNLTPKDLNQLIKKN